MRKKIILIVAFVISLNLVIGCNQGVVDNSNIEESEEVVQRVIDYSKIEGRNETFYVNGEEKPFTGKAKSYNDQGKVQFIVTYKDGKFNGESKGYYDDGKISWKANFKDGKEHGEYTIYNKDGKIVKRETYEEGELLSEDFIE